MVKVLVHVEDGQERVRIGFDPVDLDRGSNVGLGNDDL